MKSNRIVDVSIIIPTFNGKVHLKESMSKLNRSLTLVGNEIIIVDNGSSDGTGDFIRKNYKNCKYIKLNKNYGFTKAVNEGVKIAQGEYVLFLNNDCQIEKNTITELYNNLKLHKLVATQPVVYSINGKIENIGYTIDTWLGKAKPVTDTKFNYRSLSARYIYGLSGACLLINKKVFEDMGMFDESFHSYLEDVDLFIRLNKASYKYAPSVSASCVHAHMSTSSKMGLYKEKQDFKNWIRIIIKNFELKFIVKHFPSLLTERLRNLNGILKKMIR